MNSRSLLLAPLFFAPLILIAQSSDQPPPPPPPIAQALPSAMPGVRPSNEQRAYGPSAGTLIAPQATQTILEKFRTAYKSDHAPRIVVYVNRALIDQKTSAPAPALADQQTVREIERLFGRVFRNAGAQLADQKVAASLLPDQPGGHITDQAAKDREALASIADIAIEVLISSRNLVVPEVSGDVTYNVPDIQATAIRLKDSAIIGQAAASDILNKNVNAGRIVRQFGVPDITEATAIALMEDMLTR